MFKANLIKFMLLPIYWHLLGVLVFTLLMLSGLKITYLDELLQQLTKLELQHNEITQQLDTYNKNRKQIMRVLSEDQKQVRDIRELERLISMVKLADLESWLIDFTRANKIQPRQILVRQHLSDELGEYARIDIQLSGHMRNIQAFLKQSLRKEFFLIWEELIIDQDTDNTSSLSVKMSLKRYFKLRQPG